MIEQILSKLLILLLKLKTHFRDDSKGKGISIIVPFRSDGGQRAKNWEWLKSFWEFNLPDAEIIIGEDFMSLIDPSVPFSKSVAVNHGARKAKGDIFVILDADGLIDPSSIIYCAKKIREARKREQKLWFVPYRHFHRLNREASKRIIQSSPFSSFKYSFPPAPEDVQNPQHSQQGHWYGAGIQIIPREAFEVVGGWDTRFRGWGGEDHAIMRATDALYCPHKTLGGAFLHIWHPMFDTMKFKDWVDWKSRAWSNQTCTGANDRLAGRYWGAIGDPKRMRKLVDEDPRIWLDNCSGNPYSI